MNARKIYSYIDSYIDSSYVGKKNIGGGRGGGGGRVTMIDSYMQHV